MPTYSGENIRSSWSEAHKARKVAESFGVDAELYDRARPRYPEAMVERIVAASPGRAVLDVGCGTGIGARQFQAAGCTVLGVEPDVRMADFARRGALDVEVATFEDWESAGRIFDAVVSGMAWHWVDPLAGAAKAARVLRPGGRLATFWYVFEPPRHLAEAFAEVYRRLIPDSPINRQPPGSSLDLYQRMFTQVADSLREVGGFGAAEQWRYDWDQPYTRDTWLEQASTTGALTALSTDELAEVLEGLSAAIEATGDSGFTAHFTAVTVTAAKTD